jgi:hypothetical protein
MHPETAKGSKGVSARAPDSCMYGLGCRGCVRGNAYGMNSLRFEAACGCAMVTQMTFTHDSVSKHAECTHSGKQARADTPNTCTQDQIYQTKIVRKLSNPTWNAHFEWKLTPKSKFLTISVVDHVSLLSCLVACSARHCRMHAMFCIPCTCIGLHSPRKVKTLRLWCGDV